MNLGDLIGYRSWLGRLLRLPLRLIPKDTVVPIVSGPLRGKRWIVGSSTHGCWLGWYELEKQLLFEKCTTAGLVVYDVGAHVGYYSLLASKLVGPEGRVLSFEPLPRNVALLKKHLLINQCSNVTLIAAAAGEMSGKARFLEDISSSEGRIAIRGTLEVDVVSLDEIVSDGYPYPDVIKMDIEGSEYESLKGARAILNKRQPTIFLATHGADVHKACLDYLLSHGYTLLPIGGDIENTSEILAYKGKLSETYANFI